MSNPSKKQPAPKKSSRSVRPAYYWILPLLILAAAGGYFMLHAPKKPKRRAFPPFVPKKRTIRFEDFAGSESCRECHEEIYKKWSASTHGRAGGEPGTAHILGQFDGKPRRFSDGVVIPTRDRSGKPIFRVREEGSSDEKVFPVDAMVGGGHMVGGGTQTYFSRFPDGTLRFLPFDFIRDESLWFGETKTRGWVPIDKNLSMTELSEWPPSRVLGMTPDFLNCQECHGSQIEVRYDAAAKKYVSRYKTLRINCESCHGPARDHIQRMRMPDAEKNADIGLAPLAVLDKDTSLEVCFRCHALKDALQPGYLPGNGLKNYYALKFPMLGANPWHPDGRIKAFGYQQNHLFSDCYINGSMTCVDCHDPHAQNYRDIHGNPLQGKFDDRQCVDCHAAKVENPQQHTFHQPASAGSACTACHMPFLQHKAMGSRLRFARSDHTISIPRPALDNVFGIEGACRQCHQDKTTEALQEQVEAWWGPLKPLKPETQALIDASRAGAGREGILAALDPESDFHAGQAALLAHLLSQAEPGKPDAQLVAALLGFIEHNDLDIRAMALAALHLIADEDTDVHNRLIERLEKSGEEQTALRMRWAVVLGFRAEQLQNTGQVGAAATVLYKALEVWPGYLAGLQRLAGIYEQSGDFDSALQVYQRALALNEQDAGVWVNIGVVYRKQGRDADAEQAWLRAIGINPHNKLALFNLGNMAWRRKDYRAAADFYQRAVAEDPALAAGQFALARAYLMLKEYRKARDAVRASLRYDPDHANARRMLADLERVLR